MPDFVQHQIAVCANHWFRINAAYYEFSKRCGLSVSQMYVLSLIYEETEPMTHTKIQLYMAMPKASLSVMLADFNKRGWIRYEPNPDDRRVKYIKLTDEGFRFCDEIFQNMHAIERRAYERMTPDMLQQLSALELLEVQYLEESFREAAEEVSRQTS